MKSTFIFLFVLMLYSGFCSETEAGRPPNGTKCEHFPERLLVPLPGEVPVQPRGEDYPCSFLSIFNLTYDKFCEQLYAPAPPDKGIRITQDTTHYWLPGDMKNPTVEVWAEFYLPCPATPPPETTTTPKMPVTGSPETPPPVPPPRPSPPGEDGWSTKNYPISSDCDVVCDPDGVITGRDDLNDFFKRMGAGYGRMKRQTSQDDGFCNKTTLIDDIKPLNERWPFSKARIVLRFVGNLSRNASFKHFAADLFHREKVLTRRSIFEWPLLGAMWVIKGPHENSGFSYAEEFVTLDQDVEIQEVLAQLRFRIPPHAPIAADGKLLQGYNHKEGNFPCYYVRSRIQEIHAILDAMKKAKESRFNDQGAKPIDSYPSLIGIEEDEEKEEPLDPMVPALISCGVNTVLVIAFFSIMWCAAYGCRPKKSRPPMQPARTGKAGPSTMAVDMGKPSKGSEKSKKKK